MAKKGSYKLKLVKKNPVELRSYAKAVQRLVKEADNRAISEEVNNIQSKYHIDNFFITLKGEKIGVVKIFQGTYFSLGLESYIPKSDYTQIIDLIEKSAGGWRISQIEATLHEAYLNSAIELGYKIDFSRVKMGLKLQDAKNLSECNGIVTRTYQRGDLTNLIDTFIDAFRDTVDERIGFISGGTASSALSSILRGYYGEFQPELSPIVVAKDSTYIEAASLTTISEGNPFVVLIGVRRAEQSKGKGRKLLSWVISKVREKGYQELNLWVTAENKRAIELYLSMGFSEITRIYSLIKSH